MVGMHLFISRLARGVLKHFFQELHQMLWSNLLHWSLELGHGLCCTLGLGELVSSEGRLGGPASGQPRRLQLGHIPSGG
jgi:hypothetical protein